MDSKGSKSLSLDKSSKRLSIDHRKDSGYLSPITPASAASSTEGSVIRRSLSGAQTRASTSGSSGETSPEIISPAQESRPLSLAAVNMQRVVQAPAVSSHSSFTMEPLSPEDDQFANLQCPPPSNLNTSDIALLAFQCRTTHSDWKSCQHVYCYKIRYQWDLLKRCCGHILNRCCSKCFNYKTLIMDHAKNCSNQSCPVDMCNDAKNSLQAQNEDGKGSRNLPKRAHSFTERTPVSENVGLEYVLSSLAFCEDYDSMGEVARELIQAKAQEILDKLEEEEPLIKNDRPRSLTQDDMIKRVNASNALSPIVETREDFSSLLSDNLSYNSLNLILRDDQYSSYAYSSNGDGTGLSGSLPSLIQPPSLVQATESAQGVEAVVYPTQIRLHELDKTYLVAGQDGYYYQDRDYYINDVESLGSGGFGTCMYGKDNSTEQPFALKRNKQMSETIIDSMQAECFVLSRLKPHPHVIRFLGAVIDEEDNNVQLPRVCKMFLELADCGNLGEMLVVDHEKKLLEPLPQDQSLYYIQQVLQGVNFLHQNGVLHLDIKAVNVLVFNNGLTVKLADFGTAVQLSEIAAVGGKITGCTPFFASPEVVRQDQPNFSSDIWGVMCVLVELLTTKMPGCHTQTRNYQQMIFMIGRYKDDMIEEIIPLSTMNLDPILEELFRSVFIADSSLRPSAYSLLNHPLFVDAQNYASEFDYSSDEMSLDIPEAAPIPPSLDPLVTAYPPSQATPNIVGTGLQYIHGYTPSLQNGYPSLDLEQDYSMSYNHRESNDSGQGEELDNSLLSRGCPRRTSTCSSGLNHINSDSGVDTPSDQTWRKKFSTFSDDAFQETENCDNCHSYPFQSPAQDHAHFKRSSSIHGAPNTKQSDSKNAIPQPRKLVPSTHRLYHSYSAPIVGDQYNRRRLSLQMNRDESDWEGRPRLRRTSSMVYVDKGPDIDSPDREKRPSIEQLISDVSELKFDHTHTHAPSQVAAVHTEQVQNNISTVTKHVTRMLPGKHQLDPPSQKTATVYETIC